MNNMVNKLNEYLNIFNATGISFKIDCVSGDMVLMLHANKWPRECDDLSIYARFYNVDNFFEKTSSNI